MYENHKLYMQDWQPEEGRRPIQSYNLNSGSRWIKNPHAKGIILKYPYTSLCIQSHIHPKYVICHAGLGSFSKTKYHDHLHKRDELYRDQAILLHKCAFIYGEWLKMAGDDSILEHRLSIWKGEAERPGHHAPPSEGATTARRYHTRSVTSNLGFTAATNQGGTLARGGSRGRGDQSSRGRHRGSTQRQPDDYW